MALTDTCAFPPRAFAYRIPIWFRDVNGNIITGWTAAASTITNDGATSAGGAAPVEVGTTGMGYLDLTANQMDSPLVQIKCTVSNTDATAFLASIFTVDMSDTAGRSNSRLDRMIAWLFRRWANKRSSNGTTLTIQKDGNSATAFSSGSVSTSGATTTGLEMS